MGLCHRNIFRRMVDAHEVPINDKGNCDRDEQQNADGMFHPLPLSFVFRQPRLSITMTDGRKRSSMRFRDVPKQLFLFAAKSTSITSIANLMP
jgi:hypothetical protein